MEKDNKVIYPMMIELNESVESDIYYISLPKEIKDKLIELEKVVSSKPVYNLPSITLKNILCSYLDGIVDMSVVTEYSEDSKWLVCFKDININRVVTCFKIWVDEFYIKGSIAGAKRKNGSDKKVLSLANELIDLIELDMFKQTIYENVKLFEAGLATCKEAFSLYPQKIIGSLIGSKININGKEAKLIYSDKNELVTDTDIFEQKKDYYSFVINLAVQTLPPYNKAYLNVDLSIRRWVSQNENPDDRIYIGNNKNCYIRVKDDRMQCIKTKYNYDNKKKEWDDIDIRCFKECQIDSKVLDFITVLKSPKTYNNGGIGDILIPYQEGINGIETNVHSGVSFIDRKITMDFVREHVLKFDGINSVVEAIGIAKPVQKTNNDFYEGKEDVTIDSKYVVEQLEKALDGEAVNIEIYAAGDSKIALQEYLKSYIGDSDKHKIKCYDYEEYIFEKLDKTSKSNKANVVGFELRVEEITKLLNKVNTPTISFIAIHDAKYFSKLSTANKVDVDPKNAIRAGFAETGRLTQFLTFEEFEKQQANVDSADEKYEAKKVRASELGAKINKQNKTDKINKSINGAILDGLRQLGVVFNYETNKKMIGKKIIGIHICNYKKTLYGNIKPFPIIITYDVDKSKVMAYCELVDRIDIPYWKVILGLSKLGAEKNPFDLNKSISSTTMYRRLERIIYNSDSSNIIILDANGTSRKFIEGIMNSKIQVSEKNEYNQTINLLINNDKYIDLSKAKNDIAIIRLRHNNEIPSYLVRQKNSDSYLNTSGLFKYKELYYSIDQKTAAEGKAYKMSESKALKSSRYSHRKMIEMYPIYVSGNEENHNINELNAIGIVHMLRGTSIQFTSQMTILPLPLHLAMKMEEYIK